MTLTADELKSNPLWAGYGGCEASARPFPTLHEQLKDPIMLKTRKENKVRKKGELNEKAIQKKNRVLAARENNEEVIPVVEEVVRVKRKYVKKKKWGFKMKQETKDVITLLIDETPIKEITKITGKSESAILMMKSRYRDLIK